MHNTMQEISAVASEIDHRNQQRQHEQVDFRFL